MKKISILIPCYNEQDNVVSISNAIEEEINKFLLPRVDEEGIIKYDWELIFIDNDSKDNTRPLIREICARNNHVKAIFNAKNFGQFNSPYYGMCQCNGDCVILMCCDFQDPIEMIPQLVDEWEKGNMIVSCIKKHSKENKLIRLFRTCYYKMIKKMSNVEQIEHFTGFGLYDKSFIEVLRNLHDSTPFLRGIVAEFGFKRKDIEYTQAKRKAGKTHNNFFTLYDAAMLSFTSYTKVGLRIVTFAGFMLSFASIIVAIIYFIYKLSHWNTFRAGMAPIVIGVFLLSGIQLFFLGFIGEYIMAINSRVMNRPLVIEEERINFDD